MNSKELVHIIIAILVLAVTLSFTSIINAKATAAAIGLVMLFAFIIIVINIAAKKVTAKALDADVEHEIWTWSRYGFKPGWHLDRAVPIGIILPLFFTAFSLGALKVMTMLTFETSALKRRAARKFGHYSFTEMTDWHNALIGAGGIIALLALSFVTYWIPGLEMLARLSAFYAFWNMIPISRLDGAQIFFGSRVLWYSLAIITIIFASYALLLI